MWRWCCIPLFTVLCQALRTLTRKALSGLNCNFYYSTSPTFTSCTARRSYTSDWSKLVVPTRNGKSDVQLPDQSLWQILRGHTACTVPEDPLPPCGCRLYSELLFGHVWHSCLLRSIAGPPSSRLYITAVDVRSGCIPAEDISHDTLGLALPDVTIAVLSVLSSVFIVVSSVLGNSLEFSGFT